VSIYVDLFAYRRERALADSVPISYDKNRMPRRQAAMGHKRAQTVRLELHTVTVEMSSTVILCLFLVLVLYLYVRLNDAKLMQLPREVASAFSPKRISPRDALEAAAISEKSTLDAKSFLPPRTGRRYIVVGGVCSSVARERKSRLH
jgi:hypothetical protein